MIKPTAVGLAAALVLALGGAGSAFAANGTDDPAGHHREHHPGKNGNGHHHHHRDQAEEGPAPSPMPGEYEY